MQADSVESSNVVGYSTSTTVSEYGFTAIAPTFTDVGFENEISLSSITGEFERGDSIQAFDAGGNVTFTVTYKARGGVWGWYDDDNFQKYIATCIPI